MGIDIRMNNKNHQKSSDNSELDSNIKILPAPVDFRMPQNKRGKGNKVGLIYFLSWGAVAAVSIVSLSMVVVIEGGVQNAIQTAAFNKLNRQIENNGLMRGDNLPTASIPTGAGSIVKTTDSVPTDQFTKSANNFTPFDEPENDVIGATYFSVFLGKSTSESTILDLWYATKSKSPMLFGQHAAAYYFDKETGVYNLVVGRFIDLNQTLQFCAELKFHDISCQYDEKFVNLKTVSID